MIQGVTGCPRKMKLKIFKKFLFKKPTKKEDTPSWIKDMTEFKLCLKWLRDVTKRMCNRGYKIEQLVIMMNSDDYLDFLNIHRDMCRPLPDKEFDGMPIEIDDTISNPYVKLMSSGVSP